MTKYKDLNRAQQLFAKRFALEKNVVVSDDLEVDEVALNCLMDNSFPKSRKDSFNFEKAGSIEYVKSVGKRLGILDVTEKNALIRLHNLGLSLKTLGDDIETPLLQSLQTQFPDNVITALEANNVQCITDFFACVPQFDFHVGELVIVGNDTKVIGEIGTRNMRVYGSNSVWVDLPVLIPYVTLQTRWAEQTIPKKADCFEYLGKQKAIFKMIDNAGLRQGCTFFFEVLVNAYQYKEK